MSSERALSQGGLTITNDRTLLKPDIVEALQFLKCMIRQDLIYPEPAPCIHLESELQPELALTDDGDNPAATGDSQKMSNNTVEAGDDADEDDDGEIQALSGARKVLVSLWNIVMDGLDDTLYEE